MVERSAHPRQACTRVTHCSLSRRVSAPKIAKRAQNVHETGRKWEGDVSVTVQPKISPIHPVRGACCSHILGLKLGPCGGKLSSEAPNKRLNATLQKPPKNLPHFPLLGFCAMEQRVGVEKPAMGQATGGRGGPYCIASPGFRFRTACFLPHRPFSSGISFRDTLFPGNRKRGWFLEPCIAWIYNSNRHAPGPRGTSAVTPVYKLPPKTQGDSSLLSRKGT